MNTHTRLQKIAADSLNLPSKLIGDTGSLLQIELDGKKQYFIGAETPFNSTTVRRIAKDKGYTYDLLHEVINMPETLTFVDPKPLKEIYIPFVKETNLSEIVEKIIGHFKLPIVVKPLDLSQGQNVAKCEAESELMLALQNVFNHHSPLYSHIALAQEFIKISREFRVLIFEDTVRLVYEKDFSEAQFIGNLSPLHWDGAKAKIVRDPQLLDRIQQFINPIFTKLELVYGGLDIAIDTQDQMYLFEINDRPGFNHLIADEGEDIVLEFYRQILGG